MAGDPTYYYPRTKVVFLGENGHDYQREAARKAGLIAGQEYTLKQVEEHSCHTWFELEGIEGIFNSVMFESLTGEVGGW